MSFIIVKTAIIKFLSDINEKAQLELINDTQNESYLFYKVKLNDVEFIMNWRKPFTEGSFKYFFVDVENFTGNEETMSEDFINNFSIDELNLLYSRVRDEIYDKYWKLDCVDNEIKGLYLKNHVLKPLKCKNIN